MRLSRLEEVALAGELLPWSRFLRGQDRRMVKMRSEGRGEVEIADALKVTRRAVYIGLPVLLERLKRLRSGAASPPGADQATRHGRKPTACKFCGEIGHNIRGCQKRLAAPAGTPANDAPPAPPAPAVTAVAATAPPRARPPDVSPVQRRAAGPPSPRGADALAGYLAAIARHPVMTREEEQVVAREYQRTKDPALAQQLVNANLRYVVKVARGLSRGRDLLEAIQQGNLGLMRAVEMFEPERGFKLCTYATSWIRQKITAHAQETHSIVMLKRNPVTQKVFFGLAKARAYLVSKGIEPSPENLAKVLGVSVKMVTDIEPRMGRDSLLDAPVNSPDGEASPLGDLIPDDASVQPDVQAEGDEFRAALRERMERFARMLNPRDALIFRARLLAEDPETLLEIAGRIGGLSRERVRQIETVLMRRLKDFLEEELGDTIEAQYGETPREPRLAAG